MYSPRGKPLPKYWLSLEITEIITESQFFSPKYKQPVVDQKTNEEQKKDFCIFLKKIYRRTSRELVQY